MNATEFLLHLKQNPSKTLNFKIQEKDYQLPHYHLTQWMSMDIEAIHCDSYQESRKENLIQLWSHKYEEDKAVMPTDRFLEIVSAIGRKGVNIDRSAPLFFEVGNDVLPTSTYEITRMDSKEDRLDVVLKLRSAGCRPVLLAEDCGCGIACCN